MSPAYAVMAVDMPFMPMDLYYDWLYQVNHNNWNVIVPTGSRGKPEPMAEFIDLILYHYFHLFWPVKTYRCSMPLI